MASDDGFNEPEQVRLRYVLPMAFHDWYNRRRWKAVFDVVIAEYKRVLLAHGALHVREDVPDIFSEPGKLAPPVSVEGELQRLGDYPVDNSVELKFTRPSVGFRDSHEAGRVGAITVVKDLGADEAQDVIDLRRPEV
jgi:hypothetical protein